jgi:hypothetical protein
MPRRDGFGSAGASSALRSFLEFQNRRPFLRQDEQDAGATSTTADERLNAGLNQGEQ